MRTLFAAIIGLSSFVCAAQTHEPMPPQPQRTDVRPVCGQTQPAQNLFQTPADYKINDQRKNQPISE